MSTVHPTDARAKLDASIRVQLSAAFERGKRAQRHWDNTGDEVLADSGAPEAFAAVTGHADTYAASVAEFNRRRR